MRSQSQSSSAGARTPTAAVPRRTPAPAIPLNHALASRSPEAILALQNKAGNAAVTAVQRVQTGQATGVGTIGGDNAYFTTQAPEGVLRTGPSPNRLINQRVDHVDAQDHHPSDVNLRISDDGTLAVHDTEREPKEFYATNAVFQQAGAQLAQAGSDYTLVQGGAQIKTAAGTLTKVTPITATAAVQHTAAGFADLLKVQCIDVARKVIGSYQMQVVMAGGGTAPWGSGVGVPLAKHLTDTVRVGGTTTAVATAAAAARPPGRSEQDVARDYGTTLREHPDEADTAAQDMGVNRHARPKVGEGFATLSIGADDKLDYATAAEGQESTDRNHVDVWNYHFAGIVARSTSGNGWVTLENYTRNQNAQKALHTLENKLLGAYKEKTKTLWNGYNSQEPKGTHESDRIIEMIRRLAYTTREKAMHEYMALGTDQLQWQGKWFFRLYGSQPGETFHDKQYANGTGDFVNPLTVRVRKPSPG
ncbi:DUF4157 domain-containing protein [Streptomyces mirabilis]